MDNKQLQDKITELEKRIELLEQRPIYVPLYPYNPPINPSPYPYSPTYTSNVTPL